MTRVKSKKEKVFSRPFKTNLNLEEYTDFIENVEVWAQSKKVKVNEDIIEDPTFEKIDSVVIKAYDEEGIKPFVAVQTLEEMERVAECVRLFKETFESKTEGMSLFEKALWAKAHYKRIANGGDLEVKVREI